jgi:hypothetical protein
MPGSMRAVTGWSFGKCDFIVKVEVDNNEIALKTEPLFITTVQ